MRNINIEITKAVLKDYTVSFKEKEVNVRATLGLLTAGGKEITTYSINSEDWREENKFDVPLSAIKPIFEIAKTLERIVTDHCNSQMKQLEAPKENIDFESNEIF